MELIAIDPEKEGYYGAVFNGAGEFLMFLHEHGSYHEMKGPPLSARLVIERPVVDRRTPNPKSILEVMETVGWLQRGLKGPVQFYLPEEWKSGVKGDIMTARIRKLLCPEASRQLSLIKPAGKHHNYIDAYGIGLFHFGKMRKDGSKVP